MGIDTRTILRFCVVIIFCAFFCSSCSGLQLVRKRNTFWWKREVVFKNVSSPQIETTSENVEAAEDPCVCRNFEKCVQLSKRCQSSPYVEDSTENELDSDLLSSESTKSSTTTTTTAALTTTTKKWADSFSAVDLDAEDEPERLDDDDLWNCGIDARHKIVDLKGQDSESTTITEFAEYPWVLYVFHKEDNIVTSLCSASLLHYNIAITAAHCVRDYQNKEIIVRGGEWDLESEFEEEESIEHQDRRVKNVIIHPKYSNSRILNDVAILHLDEPFEKKDNIRTVCRPTMEDVYGSTCFEAGWGPTGDSVNPLEQRYMRQSQISLINRTDCENQFRQSGKGPRFRLRNTQICARNMDEGGTCVGGCGGGLYCQSKKEPHPLVLVGLASWGKCSNGQIGVFTNVLKFKDWIMDTMEDINA